MAGASGAGRRLRRAHDSPPAGVHRVRRAVAHAWHRRQRRDFQPARRAADAAAARAPPGRARPARRAEQAGADSVRPVHLLDLRLAPRRRDRIGLGCGDDGRRRGRRRAEGRQAPRGHAARLRELLRVLRCRRRGRPRLPPGFGRRGDGTGGGDQRQLLAPAVRCLDRGARRDDSPREADLHRRRRRTAPLQGRRARGCSRRLVPLQSGDRAERRRPDTRTMGEDRRPPRRRRHAGAGLVGRLLAPAPSRDLPSRRAGVLVTAEPALSAADAGDVRRRAGAADHVREPRQPDACRQPRA